ncbi:MAG: hypothetical protein NVS4B8_30610 [Herpetosiphon sp.]
MADKAETPNMRISQQGRIEVAPRAIASIAARAVCRAYGVVGMAPAGLRDSVAHVLRQEDQHRGIDVHIRRDGVTVDVYVVLAHGTRVSEVAQQVMATVNYALHQSLGFPVAAVNVHVQGIHRGA